MTALNLHERANIWRLASGRASRVAMARALGSPLLRWRYGAALAEEIVLVPQELRSADPSFANELAAGQMGLAGQLVHIGKGSPFELTQRNAVWVRELQGFAWLRHLRAAGTLEAAATARALVVQWIARGQGTDRLGREPAVRARRMMSWLANSDMLLADVDQGAFDRTAQSLGDQLIALSSAWRAAPVGYPRLLALTGLVYGDLCIAGHDRHLAQSERLLGAELTRQILPDGGHISRNTGVLVEIMLDLLPLRQCFATAKRELPAPVEAAMSRIMPMLRYMRLGDGSLARFNGVGASPVAELAAILAYDTAQQKQLTAAPQSGYARLERGDCVVIADAGSAPPITLGAQAMAGCLSFEMSAGGTAMVVNGGFPMAADEKHIAVARATASHNTLAFGGQSSARRLVNRRLERLAGGVPLALSGAVTSSLAQSENGDELEISHGGYVGEHGLVHRRRLALNKDGTKLEGSDRLGGVSRAVRLPRDVPFTIHFHLAPKVTCERTAEAGAVLRLRDGTQWQFAADGAEISIEPSVHYADPSGPARALQIVLRGSCWGDMEVRWSFEKAAR